MDIFITVYFLLLTFILKHFRFSSYFILLSFVRERKYLSLGKYSLAFNNKTFAFSAEIPFSYCPSVIGCRAVIRDKERQNFIQFYIDDKYTASFYFNESRKGSLYIVSFSRFFVPHLACFYCIFLNGHKVPSLRFENCSCREK